MKFAKKLQHLLVLLMTMILTLGSVFPAYAAWNFPTADLVAEAAICLDVDTGGIIYEKNKNQKLYPASITKIMTALVVLDRCKLDERVEFSYDAVYNVDAGSSNAEIEAGDVLTVEDCLYALLLKSANEAGNALAEHVAGSREAFAELMTEKARSLGCKNTNFTNPSGLHDENHYTTAYDMALIAAAAMKNEKFMEIDSKTSHQLAPTQRVPEGKQLYMEHKMLTNTPYHDERAVAGKTGFTRAAGNTLVTMAEENGRRLVAVVLKDRSPHHYTDTKKLLDMGFDQFEVQTIEHESLFNHQDLRDRLVADTILPEKAVAEEIETETTVCFTLPKGDAQSGMTYKLNYNLPASAPEHAVAEIQYFADTRNVGNYYILRRPSLSLILEEVPTETKVMVSVGSLTVIAIIAFFMLGGSGALIHAKNVREEKKRLSQLKERRRRRLEAMDISEEEFQAIVLQRKIEKEQRSYGEGSRTARNSGKADTKGHGARRQNRRQDKSH